MSCDCASSLILLLRLVSAHKTHDTISSAQRYKRRTGDRELVIRLTLAGYNDTTSTWSVDDILHSRNMVGPDHTKRWEHVLSGVGKLWSQVWLDPNSDKED